MSSEPEPESATPATCGCSKHCACSIGHGIAQVQVHKDVSFAMQSDSKLLSTLIDSLTVDCLSYRSGRGGRPRPCLATTSSGCQLPDDAFLTCDHQEPTSWCDRLRDLEGHRVTCQIQNRSLPVNSTANVMAIHRLWLTYNSQDWRLQVPRASFALGAPTSLISVPTSCVTLNPY